MKHKVAVIVPIFNAAPYLTRLIDSISAAYPEPIPNLRFILADDASPEKANAALYKKHAFFKRDDVTLVRRKKNVGYTGNVNQAIFATAKNEDVVLLNSDTEIGPQLFEHLQSVAQSNPLCGSVTPMTNHGTIASVFNWPNGGDWTSRLSVEEVNQTLQGTDSAARAIQIPTPVGFCTYFPKRAIAAVGLFDEERFPRGYGEENDWAMRASRFGLVHYLTLGAFVVHASGKSFKETKTDLIDAAMQKLARFHPEYHQLVSKFIQLDPWENERWDIQLQIAKAHRQKLGRKSIAFVLHSDPEYFAGGVEVTVKAMSRKRLEQGFDVFQIFPHNGNLHVRYLSLKNFKWETTLTKGRAAVDHLKRLIDDVDILHTHHVQGVWPELLLMLSESSISEKIISLHDYWSICPSVKLIDVKQNYCGVPKDMSSCNKCFAVMQPGANTSIQRYRMSTMRMLLGYDSVEVPSEEAKELLIDGFSRAFHSRDIIQIKVRPNAVPSFDAKPVQREFRKRVIFLGALSFEKGGNLVNEILPALEALGYEAEIWGLPGVVQHSPLTVTSYRNSQELHRLRSRADGAIVCVPSIWPETFSYTFYEAVSILGAPVVVGPYGHPATVTKAAKIGEVMAQPNSRALMKAITNCAKNFSNHQRKVDGFKLNEFIGAEL